MQFRKIRQYVGALAAATFLSPPVSAAYVANQIDFIDPVTHGVAAYTWIWGMNNKGQVVGQAGMTLAEQFNFVYDPTTGTFAVVPQPPGLDGVTNFAAVLEINDQGAMSGATNEGPLIQRGFFLSGGNYSFISYPGKAATEGRGIANPTSPHPQGLVTGYANSGGGFLLDDSVPFVYDPTTAAFAVLPIPNSYFTNAQGINAAGQIVGYLTYQNGSGAPLANGRWAFLFTPSNRTDPMLGGTVTPFRVNGGWTNARGINDTGLITGTSLTPQGFAAYVGNSSGYQLLDMPVPVGTNCNTGFGGGSVGYAVNNAGQVAGTFIDDACNIHGYVATPASAPTGTTSNGAYTCDVDVVADTPIFIDPPVATGYSYKIGRGDPLIATVTLPMGIGDNRFLLVLGDTETYRVNGGQQFDFRTHGYSAGVSSFSVRCVDPGAMLNPTNPLAFPTGLTFASSGKFTGTQKPMAHTVNSTAPDYVARERCLSGVE